MTWTKLGQEFPENARKLSDAAFRLHVEALCWANRVGSDLTIEPDDLGHLAFTPDPKSAAAELVTKKWWVTTADGWYIGEHRPEWQLEAAVVEARREANALRQQRHRLHSVGDHSLCTDRCSEVRNVTRDVTGDVSSTRDPERIGTARSGSDVGLGNPPQQQIPEDDPDTIAEWIADEARRAAGDAA